MHRLHRSFSLPAHICRIRKLSTSKRQLQSHHSIPVCFFRLPFFLVLVASDTIYEFWRFTHACMCVLQPGLLPRPSYSLGWGIKLREFVYIEQRLLTTLAHNRRLSTLYCNHVTVVTGRWNVDGSSPFYANPHQNLTVPAFFLPKLESQNPKTPIKPRVDQTGQDTSSRCHWLALAEFRARDWPATLDAEGEASSRRRRSHRPTKIIN